MVANRFQGGGLSFPVRLAERGQRKDGKAPRPKNIPHGPPKTAPSLGLPLSPLPVIAAPSLPARRLSSPAAIRRKIVDSSIVDMLIDYVEGRIEMEPEKVTVALSLAKKIIPDLSNVAPPPDLEGDEDADDLSKPMVEFVFVEPETK